MKMKILIFGLLMSSFSAQEAYAQADGKIDLMKKKMILAVNAYRKLEPARKVIYYFNFMDGQIFFENRLVFEKNVSNASITTVEFVPELSRKAFLKLATEDASLFVKAPLFKKLNFSFGGNTKEYNLDENILADAEIISKDGLLKAQWKERSNVSGTDREYTVEIGYDTTSYYPIWAKQHISPNHEKLSYIELVSSKEKEKFKTLEKSNFFRTVKIEDLRKYVRLWVDETPELAAVFPIISKLCH
jgi:hypothetical protein